MPERSVRSVPALLEEISFLKRKCIRLSEEIRFADDSILELRRQVYEYRKALKSLGQKLGE